MTPTVRHLVLASRTRLVAAGIDANEAAMDAALLARHALGWEPARLLAHDADPAPCGFADAFDALLARRERREPMSRILGHREFRHLDFVVTGDVLAPRPETETIIEQALVCLSEVPSPAGPHMVGGPDAGELGRQASRPMLFADVGTGSGCLAVSLAAEVPAARIVATDTSTGALAVAARNARRHGVADRIEFRLASLLDGISEPLALVVSNPPYVATSDIPTLPPEVRDWEPREALDGGADGLDIFRSLVASASAGLMPGGWLVAEFGYGQEEAVRDAIARSAVELVRVARDLQGIPRTVVARKGSVV